MEDDRALVIQRRLGELEKVYDWPQWRDNPDLDRPTLREVGTTLALLPVEPSTKQIDILLTVTVTDGIPLRTVLPQEAVAELLGGRDTPYTINDLILELGVDSVFVGSEYARETGYKGDPELLIGGAILASNNDLESADDLVALIDAYRNTLNKNDEDTFQWLARHPWRCRDFLRLLESNEGKVYLDDLRKLDDFYASQKYEEGAPEAYADGEGSEEDNDTEDQDHA